MVTTLSAHQLARTTANLLGAVTLLAVARDYVKNTTILHRATDGELQAFAHALGQLGDLHREFLPLLDQELRRRDTPAAAEAGD
jgi:hypothetical protein